MTTTVAMSTREMAMTLAEEDRKHKPRRVLDTSMITRDRQRDQDTRTPKHTGHVAFVDVSEERFAWQRMASETDAFYSLPGTMGGLTPVFGSSTRADWEGTFKNKRDGQNPYAGPGNYNTSNFTALSTNSNPAKVKFGFGPRTASSLTKTPGPCYNIDGVFKDGRDSRIGTGFNKDYRKPLLVHATDATYYPQLRKSTSVIMGQKLKVGSQLNGAENRSPGPIYNVAKYGFKTGPTFSFGASRNPDRFKHSGLGW